MSKDSQGSLDCTKRHYSPECDYCDEQNEKHNQLLQFIYLTLLACQRGEEAWNKAATTIIAKIINRS